MCKVDVEVLWEPGNFQDDGAKRVGMCFATNTDLELWTEEVEQGVIDNMIIFQKPFPGAARTELESQLQRAVKVSAKGKHVKCKIDLERCLFWDPAGNRVPHPAGFAHRRGRALVEARHVWLMARQWGVLFEVRHLWLGRVAHSSSWFFSRMPLSSLTPSGSTSATATKTPLGIFPPAPTRRSPGQTPCSAGCFVLQFGYTHWLFGNQSMWMTSSSRSFEPFALSVRKISCASPARRWPLYSCPSASTTSAAPRAPPAALGS